VATVTLGRYVFVEESGRLQIMDSVGEQAVKLILSALLALGGVAGSVALLVMQGPAKAGWWLLATGTLAVLGIWLLSHVIVKGRTIWTFDRESGEVLHRGKFLRSLSSITHLAVFSFEWPALAASAPSRLVHYVEFAPRQGESVWLKGAGSRKETLVLSSLKDASQAATILAAFLGVGVVAESVHRP
jgi:hypothetical protein